MSSKNPYLNNQSSVKTLFLAAFIGTAASLCQAQTPFSFSDNFDSYDPTLNNTATGAGSQLPVGAANANATRGYWYRAEDKGVFGFTQSGGQMPNMSGTAAIPGYGGKFSMLWSGAMSTSFAVRNLHSGGALAQGQSLLNPTLSVDTAWRHFNANTRTFLGFVNDDNQGFGVSITTNGNVLFYQINDFALSVGNTNIVPNGWTQLGSAQVLGDYSQRSFGQNNPNPPEVNTLTFSVTDSALTLAASLAPEQSVTFDLSGISGQIPSGFTSIILGGRMDDRQQIYYDNLQVTGAAIPEGSTVSLLLGAAAVLYAAVICRRR